jgi:cell division protein FtsL
MGTQKNWRNEMATFANKEAYKNYSKSEKRFYWGFVVAVVCAASLLLAWKPYILPLLKILSQ